MQQATYELLYLILQFVAATSSVIALVAFVQVTDNGISRFIDRHFG